MASRTGVTPDNNGGGTSRDLGPGQIAEHGSHGGLFATIISGIALVMSGLSYYDSALKSSDLAVFVPPMIHYARDGDNDVFNIPVTITNDGARSGTILSMKLDVENLRAEAARKHERFHSAFLGEWPRDDKTVSRSFAPLSIPGHGTFTETVRFYPMDEALPFIVDEKGDYRFTLKLVTARPTNPDLIERLWHSEPKPLTFELKLPYISFQHLTFRHGTLALYNKAWQPAVSTSGAPEAGGKDASAPADSGEAKPEPPRPEPPKSEPAKPDPAKPAAPNGAAKK